MCVLVVRSIENVFHSERMKRRKNKHILTGDISCYYTKIMSCDMQIQRRSYSFCYCSAVLAMFRIALHLFRFSFFIFSIFLHSQNTFTFTLQHRFSYLIFCFIVIYGELDEKRGNESHLNGKINIEQESRWSDLCAKQIEENAMYLEKLQKKIG